MPPKEPRRNAVPTHTEQWLKDRPGYKKHSILNEIMHPGEGKISILKNPIEEEYRLNTELEKLRAAVSELRSEQKILDPTNDAILYNQISELITTKITKIVELNTQLNSKKD